MSVINIAVDGPSGVGKSSVCSALADEFHLTHIDTGGMYRAIALGLHEMGIAPVSSRELEEALKTLNVTLDKEKIFLNGKDVSNKIRTGEVSLLASQYAKLPEVRSRMSTLQREIAHSMDSILDGRDIGTVVLPDADVKLYLTASSKARALRRYLQDQQAGRPVNLEQIEKEIEERDYQDSHRKIAPLKPSEDALIVDTSNIDKEQTIALCSKLVRERLQKGTV